MMSNETFALLTPVAMLIGVAAFGGLLYWDMVRRHPARTSTASKPAAPAIAHDREAARAAKNRRRRGQA